MTAPVTPKARAEKLAVQLLGRAMNSQGTVGLIASAIRDAENAAYERSAREILLVALMNEEIEGVDAIRVAASLIRSWKTGAVP